VLDPQGETEGVAFHPSVTLILCPEAPPADIGSHGSADTYTTGSDKPAFSGSECSNPYPLVSAAREALT
jgi:hypothetical protein